MESPLATEERHQFSDRLRQALRSAHVSSSPSTVTKEFNLRADGATVTSHAVRKWLTGEAIPTHERLMILSGWLGVHASWLLYGEEANTDFSQLPAMFSMESDELSLINDFKCLSPDGQYLAREMLKLLLSTGFARTENDQTERTRNQ
ncbi:MAG TPA: hypothetical protein VGC21_09460 [Telluria sp.]|jgi:transcriptional regulator with XRE-family HTH domain